MLNIADVIVLIPVYKNHLTTLEQYSCDCSSKALANRKLCFIGPENLVRDYYENRYPNISFVSFNDHCFSSVKEYSRLLLSESFYNRFVKYQFILIMQPDAIVLHDDLDWWCQQPYDYIGAPWPAGHIVIKLADKVVSPTVGNGGLSLRRVEKCIASLRSFSEMAASWQKAGTNEDLFFASMAFLNSNFRVPDQYFASRFSMEFRPSHFFSINGGFFPMGGHAWFGYEPQFWIPLLGKANLFSASTVNLKAINSVCTPKIINNNQAQIPPLPPCSSKIIAISRKIAVMESHPRKTADKSLKIGSCEEMIQRFDKAYELIRRKLTDYLKKTHGETGNERFWELFLYVYIHFFLDSFLSRWNRSLPSGNPGAVIAQGEYPPATVWSFQKNGGNIVGKNSPYVNFRYVNFPQESARNFDLDLSFVNELNVAVSKLKDKMTQLEKFGYLHSESSPGYWLQYWKTMGVSALHFPLSNLNLNRSIDWLHRAEIASWDDDLLTADYPGLWASIAFTLPREALEDFSVHYSIAEKIMALKEPSFLFSQAGMTASARIAFGLWAEAGIPLIINQHGGHHPAMKWDAYVQIESRLADRFCVWGDVHAFGLTPGRICKAVSSEPTKILPLCSAFLAEKTRQNSILIMGKLESHVPSFWEGTDMDPYGKMSIIEYLESLSPADRKRVIYRGRTYFFGYDESRIDNLKYLFPEIEIDPMKYSLAFLYAQAAKVIIETPITTSQWECEYLGVPYIILNPASSAFCNVPGSIPETY